MKHYYRLALLLLAFVCAGSAQAYNVVDPGMGYCAGWEPIDSGYPNWQIIGWVYHPEWEKWC